MASQMSTPIFDELLREMTAAADTSAPPTKPKSEPAKAEPPGGRRRKPE